MAILGYIVVKASHLKLCETVSHNNHSPTKSQVVIYLGSSDPNLGAMLMTQETFKITFYCKFLYLAFSFMFHSLLNILLKNF